MTIQEIKDNNPIDQIVSRYTDLKPAGGQKLQAVINPIREEKTSSLFLYLDTQKYHDFGTDETGDVIDFIENIENLSKVEAINFLGGDSMHSVAPVTFKPIEDKQSIEERLKEVRNEVERFNQSSDFQTMRNPDYLKELVQVSPRWVINAASVEAIKKFRMITTFDTDNNTIVIKIHDYAGELISYKRRRFKNRKWDTAWGTHPNGQCLLNMTVTNAPVYIVEGHHDYLTAILLGINCIMIPTVGYKKFKPEELSLLSGRDVVFIPDLDHAKDEQEGVGTMEILSDQIIDANSVNIIDVGEVLRLMDITIKTEKIDLSEVVENWNRGTDELKSALMYIGDKNVMFEGGIF